MFQGADLITNGEDKGLECQEYLETESTTEVVLAIQGSIDHVRDIEDGGKGQGDGCHGGRRRIRRKIANSGGVRGSCDRGHRGSSLMSVSEG